MANKVLEIALKLTGEDGLRGALSRTGNAVKGLGDRFTQFMKNPLMAIGAFAGLYAGLRKSWEEADELTRSMQRLQGTAKIMNVPLAELVRVADQAKEAFGLSTKSANNFASSAVTMAAKAGDVAKSGELMAAVLNLAAARGISADEALEALNITLKGQDEGLDKLVQRNPSAFYKEWADANGRTAGSLSETEKSLAIVDGLLREGGKVRDAYVEWLKTTEGQAFLTAQKTEEAWGRVGVATSNLRGLLAGMIGWLADKSVEFVGGLQIIAADAVKFFLGVPAQFQMAWGRFMVSVANSIADSRLLLTIFGDGLTEVADKLGKSGTDMMRAGSHRLVELQGQYDEKIARIIGIVEAGETRQTAAASAGAADRATIASADKKAREDTEKAATKAVEKLRKDAHEATLEALPAMYREYLQLKETFDAAMLSQDRATRQEAERLFRAGHVRILMAHADLNRELEPKVRETRLQLKGISTTWRDAVEEEIVPAGAKAAESLDRFLTKAADLGDKIREQAGAILEFSKAVGAVNPELEQMIAGVGRLAGGLSDVAKSITPGGLDFSGFLGGLTGAVLGLQGIVGSLFGESPAERARKELLRRNTEALDRLRTSVGDLYRSQLPGAKVAAFGELDATAIESLAAQGQGAIRKTDLAKLLLRHGLSIGDFTQLAGELGPELDEVRGGTAFSLASVRQFLEALNYFEPGQFSQTFAGQTDFIDALLATTGSTDPRERLALITQALGGAGGSGALSSLIGGADLNSAEGVANLRAQLASFITQANSTGGIDPTIAGGLSTGEFVRAIEMVAGILGEFTFDTGTSMATVTAGIGDAFTAPASLTAGGSNELMTALVRAGELTARHTGEMVELMRDGALGSTVINTGIGGPVRAIDPSLLDAVDEAFQLSRDLRATVTGTY